MAKKPKDPKPDAASEGVYLVMEGDSWERLPNWGAKKLPIVGGANYDLERALRDHGHRIENLAYWGDTIEEIATRLDFVTALADTKARYFLLGGGGNDLLHEGRLRDHLMVYEANRKPAAYLKPSFDVALSRVMKFYELCFDALEAHKLKPQVVVHGYDYARPMELCWIGQPMIDMGIERLDLQQAIVGVMMDRFNRRLKKLAADTKRVTYVDLRGMVQDDWHDELHPNKDGFDRIARKIQKAF